MEKSCIDIEKSEDVLKQTEDSFHAKTDFSIENQVFNNDVILRRLFGILTLEDIKQCRLVCDRWKTLSEYRFRKISKIVFNDRKFYSSRKIQNFDTLFQNRQSVIPFTTYKFEGTCRTFSRFKKLMFFKQSRKFVKDLALENVTLAHEETGFGNPCINISDLRFRPNIITKLSISQCDYGTKWTISWENLVSIQILELVNCNVHLPLESWKILPISVLLKNVIFIRDGKKLDNVTINDCIDFSRIETLALDCRIGKTMSIDLTDVSIDVLSLAYIKILNWGSCSCKVRKLSLWGIPYVQRNRYLQVKELKIDCTVVELSALPKTLEKLELIRNNVTCEIETTFQNVKFLKYSKNEIDPLNASIPNLEMFINLVDISLTSPYTAIPLDLNFLPKMIKRMKLDNIMIIGDGVYNVDTLIIKNGYWIDARKLLDKIIPCNLVMYRKQSHNLFKVKDVDRIRFLIEKPFQTITLGKMEWRDENEFRSSDLSKIVDAKAEYYTFVDQIGYALSEQEFNNIVKMKF